MRDFLKYFDFSALVSDGLDFFCRFCGLRADDTTSSYPQRTTPVEPMPDGKEQPPSTWAHQKPKTRLPDPNEKIRSTQRAAALEREFWESQQ